MRGAASISLAYGSDEPREAIGVGVLARKSEPAIPPQGRPGMRRVRFVP
jgi:hypothetical protein